MSVAYRLNQVRTVLADSRKAAPDLPNDARERLTEPMLHQFRILPVADQRHLLAVHRWLRSRRADDDTVTAGLIHDVGKACAKCRITLLDRGLHVILSRVLPGPYARFASMEMASDRVRGLHRLANHAERGALAAEQAGYSPRVIELVRHHERGGDCSDAQLALLREADRLA